jgi:hypothetical protein
MSSQFFAAQGEKSQKPPLAQITIFKNNYAL